MTSAIADCGLWIADFRTGLPIRNPQSSIRNVLRTSWILLARVALLLCAASTWLMAAAPQELPKLSLGNFAPAIRQQIEKAYAHARLDPKSPGANGKMGMLLQAYEQFEAASVWYKRARLFAPREFRWAYYLGTVQAALGKHDEAAATLRESLRQNPDYIPARLKLAESLRASGEWSESQQIYEAIVEKHPNSALSHYGLGRVKAVRGNNAAALENYLRACDLFNNFGASHYALGLAYRSLGEANKAQEHFALYEKDKLGWPPLEDPMMEAIAELKTGAQYHVKKGVSLEASGQLKLAAAEHERALAMDPKHVQAHVNLITLYGKLGQAEKAEKHYRAAVEINPNLEESHYNFGVLLTGQGKNREAVDAFRRALEINPYYAEAHNNYGYIVMAEGKLEEAERHFRSAIENKPNYRLAHFHLGRILLHQGKHEEAIHHFLQTLTPEDESTPGYMYALGAAYARAGDRQNALRYVREARQRAASLGQTDLLASIEKDLRVLEQATTPP